MRHDVFPGGGRLKFPVVETVQKHLCQVVHGLPVLLGQMAKLVQDKVGYTFGDAGLLEGRVSLKEKIPLWRLLMLIT